jgi:hypothetical protein
MNALVGQEAKANFSLFWRFCDDGADDGGRKDGGDFTRAGAGGHLRGRCEFEVLHDGSEELQPSQMMCAMFRSGWQFRVIGLIWWLGLDAPAGQRCLSGREPYCALTKQLTGFDLLDTMTSIN